MKQPELIAFVAASAADIYEESEVELSRSLIKRAANAASSGSPKAGCAGSQLDPKL